MTSKIFKGRIKQKYDTAANWAKVTNFVPLPGEICVYDNGDGQSPQIKIGDGKTAIGALPFIKDEDKTGIIDVNGNDISRTFYSLVANGKNIPNDSDLNSIDFIAVGNYKCWYNAQAQSLINCPTQGRAFMMQVFSPASDLFDNETTAMHVHRTRKIITYSGEEFYQYVGLKDNTAEQREFFYGPWLKTINSKDLNSYYTKQEVDNAITTALANITAAEGVAF